MILPDEPIERLFSLKWTIENMKVMKREELKRLKSISDEEQTKKGIERIIKIEELLNGEDNLGDEVVLNLQVTILRDNGDQTYYLIPLKSIPIFSLLEEFKDTNHLLEHFEDNYQPIEEFESKDLLLEFSENIMMSILTFASRTIYYLTENEEIEEHLKNILNLSTFEGRRDLILEFTDNYLVKSLCEICEEMDFYSEEFQEEELDYAHKSGLYDNYIDSIKAMEENIAFQIIIKNDIEALRELLGQTFKSAKVYLQDINVSEYETIIDTKVSNDEMKETIESIEANFFTKGLTPKVFGQFKTKRHPLSFLFTDSLVKSKYSDKYVLQSLVIGLVNSAISVSIINAINKKNRDKYVDQIETLKLFNVDDEKMFLAEHLVRLCDSKKYIQYIPILAISSAYNGLSEKKVTSLSKLLLQSVNPDTLQKHYTSLSHIDVWEQIEFNN